MEILDHDIEAISQRTLPLMKNVIDRNEQEKRFDSDDTGPLALASALSDFFGISQALELGQQTLDIDQISDFADYGLHLLDRLAFQRRALGMLEQREDLARVYASIGLWFARRDAELDNLEGIADGFALLTNGLTEPAQLAEMCLVMEEVVDAASEKQRLDEDRSNPWRPWRVLNLNVGIAAARSLNAERMEQAFTALGQRLPYDMPGFFADGLRQVLSQDVPGEVREVMQRFAQQWPLPQPH